MPDNFQPPAGPGRPKDPAKREAILAAAKRLFIERGYSASSMDAIAAEAGVSKLTVYSHFTDKETLFVTAIMAKCEEQLPPPFFEFNPSVPIETTLLTIGRGFHNLINSEEAVALHRTMQAQATHSPELSRLFYDAGPQRVLTAVENLLREAHRAGLLDVANPLPAAEHFLSLIKGGHNFRQQIGIAGPLDEAAIEQHVQDVVKLFLRAFSAAAPSAR